MGCEVGGEGWKLHGGGGEGSCPLFSLSRLFPIIPEQKQDDQKRAAQVGFCFLLGRGSS